MEEKQDVLRVMKHDLKGPLTLIKGYLSFWENDTFSKFPPEKQKEFILKALAGANKMEELVEETFRKIMAMRDEGNLQPTPKNDQ
jgi:light-regulated signal transduction histidine kinase (bacteriophytochrome)